MGGHGWLLAACLCGVHGDPNGLVLSGKGGRRPSGALAVSRDIEQRVVEAGGNTQGVLVASLSWTSADDLDLHVVLPQGEISYKHKKLAGGELDVDMCVQGRHSGKCADRPVENVVFHDEAPAGRYKVYVQNFNYHLNTLPENMQVARMQEGVKTSKEERALRLTQNRPVLFDLLLKVHGVKKLYEGLCTPTGKTLSSSDVLVLEFDYDPATESIATHLEATAAAECADYGAKLRAALAGPSQAPQVAKASPKASQASSKVPRAAPKAPKAKSQALQAIRSASKETLMGKPLRALRELLVDLGASCRACSEKVEFVERLQELAADEL